MFPCCCFYEESFFYHFADPFHFYLNIAKFFIFPEAIPKYKLRALQVKNLLLLDSCKAGENDLMGG